MDIPTVDEIEQAKYLHYKNTGQHLSIIPRKGRIDMTITDKPIAPVMLPLAKPQRRSKLSAIKIKVNRKK